MSRVAVNGVTYHVEERGEGPPLLLLHGFTGSAATWRRHHQAFASWRRLIAPDLLGHGGSDAPDDWRRYALARQVDDLLALLDARGAGRCDVLGYSLGGRVALHLALAAPERLGALVLVGASPGMADPGERAARREQDEALARLVESRGTAAFVDYWEALPLLATQAALPAAVRAEIRRERLRHRPQGLAGSLRGAGAGRQEPLWDRLPALAIPVLLVAGEQDAKYCGLVRAMGEALPAAEQAVVPGAGHAVHLEAPDRFQALAAAFLRRRSPLGAGARGGAAGAEAGNATGNEGQG